MSHSRFYNQFTLSALACEHDVRVLLRRVRARLTELGVSEATCSSAELVLAEALNNITEHAYAGRSDGPVQIQTHIGPGIIQFTLSDHGVALPGSRLPAGTLPDHDVPLDDLPEGGFGWFLIRDLTNSVNYDREGDENRLVMTLPNSPGG